MLDLTEFEAGLIANIQKTNVFRNVIFSKEKHLTDKWNESDKNINDFLKRCHEYESIDSDEVLTSFLKA